MTFVWGQAVRLSLLFRWSEWFSAVLIYENKKKRILSLQVARYECARNAVICAVLVVIVNVVIWEMCLLHCSSDIRRITCYGATCNVCLRIFERIFFFRNMFASWYSQNWENCYSWEANNYFVWYVVTSSCHTPQTLNFDRRFVHSTLSPHANICLRQMRSVAGTMVWLRFFMQRLISRLVFYYGNNDLSIYFIFVLFLLCFAWIVLVLSQSHKIVIASRLLVW